MFVKTRLAHCLSSIISLHGVFSFFRRKTRRFLSSTRFCRAICLREVCDTFSIQGELALALLHHFLLPVVTEFGLKEGFTRTHYSSQLICILRGGKILYDCVALVGNATLFHSVNIMFILPQVFFYPSVLRTTVHPSCLFDFWALVMNRAVYLTAGCSIFIYRPTPSLPGLFAVLGNKNIFSVSPLRTIIPTLIRQCRNIANRPPGVYNYPTNRSKMHPAGPREKGRDLLLLFYFNDTTKRQ